jgi:glycosyltransferase involved in cell wall biosynthesis
MIRLGVDLSQFKHVNEETKFLLRRQYGVPTDKKIALHVGHLNRERGLSDIMDLINGNMQALIVVSTSTKQDQGLKNALVNKGALIVDTFVEHIEHYYQLADIYIFPTQRRTSAIEFPLSVIEAASCGLPIIATPFGGLPDHFEEHEGFRFFDNIPEGRLKLKHMLSIPANGHIYSNVNAFSWEAIAREVLNEIEVLLS